MPNIFNTAAHILRKTGSIPAMKLQRLIYYSQAWALAWDNAPLFSEPIQAWANGPISPALYNVHCDEYLATINMVMIKQEGQLSAAQIETINTVLDFYEKHSSQSLGDQTKSEPPWTLARIGIPADDRGYGNISHNSMRQYYGGL